MTEITSVQYKVTNLSHWDPINSMFASSDLWKKKKNQHTEGEATDTQKKEYIYRIDLIISRKMSNTHFLTIVFKNNKKE